MERLLATSVRCLLFFCAVGWGGGGLKGSIARDEKMSFVGTEISVSFSLEGSSGINPLLSSATRYSQVFGASFAFETGEKESRIGPLSVPSIVKSILSAATGSEKLCPDLVLYISYKLVIAVVLRTDLGFVFRSIFNKDGEESSF